MNYYEIPEVYALKHKKMNVRVNSQAGGAFTALSDWVLDRNGIVYGSVLSDDFLAVHVRAENKEQRDKMRGSKYIQSDIGNCMSLVKKDLEEGKWVLFSGTPCQVAGLRSYLGKEYEKFIGVDFVCHGVPSPMIWRTYIDWWESKTKRKCIAADFRNRKKFHWLLHVETLYMENKKGSIKQFHSEMFKELFYGHYILRPSCFSCPYKTIQRVGDISIAHFLSIQKANPEFDNDEGTSMVLINNEKGKEVFLDIMESVEVLKCRLEDGIQPSMIKPYDMPEERRQFWEDFKNESFDTILKKYAGLNMKTIIKRRMIRLRSRLGKMKRAMLRKFK